MPRDTSPTLWPARPTRCRPLATEGGASTCTTRSTAPMSMPSSRLEVATTAGSRPALSASSISARSCRDTEPWCARATSAGAPAAPACAMISAACCRPTRWRAPPLGAARRGQLVQPPAQPLGQPPRVREHDRGLVLLDQVEHPLLDVRPDRPRRRAPARRIPVRARTARRGIQLGHVLDRDDHGQLDALGAGRLHHGHRPGAAEERGHLAHRPHRGRQPHPLCWPGGRTPSPDPPGGAGARSRAARPAVPATAPGARRACSRRPRAPRPR